MTNRFRMPPKYQCQICHKMFRGKKKRDDHVLFNRCRGMQSTNKKQIAVVVQPIELELVSMKDEIVHSDPRTTQYLGREYNFNPIPTGNRHLRSGLPLPRISKYRSAAI